VSDVQRVGDDVLAKSSRRGATRGPSPALQARRTLPFLAAASTGIVLAPVLPGALDLGSYIVSLELTVLAAGVALLTGFLRSVHVVVGIAGPLIYVGSVAMLRESAGGAASGLSVLFLLPVIWTALYTSRWQLWAVLVAIAAAVVVPVAIEGPPRYPTNEYGRAALLMIVGAVVGLTVERLQRRSEQRTQELSDTLDGALDAFMAFDATGRTVAWNSRAESLFGWSAAEVLGRDPVEFMMSTDERAKAVSAFREGLRDRDPKGFRLIAPIRTRSGEVRQINVAARAMRTASGLRYNVFAHDATGELATQAALAASERRFRGAVEASPIGMATASIAGRIDRVNEAFCTLLGRDEVDLVGTQIEQLVEPGDREREVPMLRSLLAREIEHYHLECRFRHGAGDQLWTQMHVTVLDDEAGRPHALMVQLLDITERRRFEAQLQHLADHDPLTGLLNRRGLAAALAHHVDHCARYGPDGALMLLDLDGFKYVNDTHGHDAGDELVVSVAQVIQHRLRTTDTVARLGGDEFAILLPKVDVGQSELVADSILKAVATVTLRGDDGARPVTASIGIARFDDSGVSADEVLTNADLAMYDAKEMGRNRYSHYSTDEHHQPRIKSRMKWLDRIAHALDNDGLLLEAMPILDLSTNRVDEYELLLRMRGDDGSLIPPATFLYIAERFELIGRIDGWVAAQAIDLLAEIDDAGLSLAINVSGKSITDPALLGVIDDRLRATGADPARLTVELTETAAVADILAARRFASAISELGCRLALDDFGAGFGSFYYLKHLPFDVLKIDGEFVKHCARERTDQHIVRSLASLASGMGKRTVAEFTADAATLAMVRELGVDAAQGYQIGLPVNADCTLRAYAVAAAP
jgi:diguanylate cyclase (GGDEF)-like protein/PAS domain S-box-containing protein